MPSSSRLPELPRIPRKQAVFDQPSSRGDSRPSLQEAIRRLSESGGGRILVRPGIFHLHGPLELFSGVELALSEGTILRFSGNPANFLPVRRVRWEGIDLWSYSPLITAQSQTDIALTGRGVIDGCGSRTFSQWKALQGPCQQRAREAVWLRTPLHHRVFGINTRLRPSLFQPMECRRVLVEGVTFLDAPFWVVHPTYCDEVTIRGVSVQSLNPNNDGCDPDSCRHVLVEDCVFETGDDAIALKSGRDEDGREIGRPTEDVLIRRCRLNSRINGICLGSELSGGLRNIRVTDCAVEGAASAIYLKTNSDRGGGVSDVLIENIQVAQAAGTVIRLETSYHGCRQKDHRTTFENVMIRNIHSRREGTHGLCLRGWRDGPPADIRIENIRFAGAILPVWARHGDGIVLKNVEIGPFRLSDGPVPESPEPAALSMPM